MASKLKPKKAGFRSKLRRLFSRSSSNQGLDKEASAHNLDPLASSSSPDHDGRAASSSMGKEPEVSVLEPQRRAGTETGPSPIESGSTASTSMFSRAHHFNVGNIQINSPKSINSTRDGWQTLLDKIAPNAFHDSGARFDPPKCDEDTRVEVIGEIMNWIGDRESPQRLLCMTGAAGAGKSALQQTIAESCADSGIFGAAFFFSSQDLTRSNLSRIIPTIACQLGQHNPTLQEHITKAIERDPLIFTKTIRLQMDTLIVRPFKQLCANDQSNFSNFPHAILIDGLDECAGEEQQTDLLMGIQRCLLDTDLPFRIFITSRPEWAIRSALNLEPPGYLHQLAYHIQLSDKYDATDDIRRFLWRRLRDIGARSHDPHARIQSWPREEDIKKLVVAASGQFVYAATVVKYVSERRSSPVDRLQTILSWTPEEAPLARPFESLDILYTSILSTAKELYEAVDTNRGRNFLFFFRAHHINSDFRVDGSCWGARTFDELLNLETGAHETIVSDLQSLVTFVRNRPVPDDDTNIFIEMRFYHRSFSEFLDSEFRAKDLFIPETLVKNRVLEIIVQGILHSSSQNSCTYISLGASLDALSQYSNGAEELSEQQILSLARSNEWKELIIKSTFDRFSPDKFLQTISVILRRLKDGLQEVELANAFEVYYNRWEQVFT